MITDAQCSKLLPAIKAWANERFVLLQETKLVQEASAMVAQIPAGTFKFSPACIEDDGTIGNGPSGGLCTIIPNHLPIRGDIGSVQVCPGYCFYVEVMIADIQWRIWNIYAPPGRQARVRSTVEAYIATQSQEWTLDAVNVGGGDLNLDPVRDGDRKEMEAWIELLGTLHTELIPYQGHSLTAKTLSHPLTMSSPRESATEPKPFGGEVSPST